MHQQNWVPERYKKNAQFVSELGTPLIDLLQPQSKEIILDLGCGDGTLTNKIMDSGAFIVGGDSSQPQLNAAKSIGIKVCACDGGALPFKEVFDAVFSNAALHWMASDPNGVLSEIWLALKKGGRLVAEMGGAGNCETIIQALFNALKRRNIEPEGLFPWFFPDVARIRIFLTKSGFKIGNIKVFSRPTELPGDISVGLRPLGRALFLLFLPNNVMNSSLK